ncbi:protein of unknown function DUF1906 [Gemmatirosa kalamazoonensis]|jgi:hypothetical protein|uniref:Rv2525c-like glycoside hydrolase-like domain-containing protein n=1 Tax=Gemmatirosa kalamazoonensis TaxID=861299 RepID=W0RBT3_9BACT|nr:glycoside hydrolase domain-containing protein [Gemmatirosa kalamazoonensis]AHG88564.1 protein of unknown function DUF1906 [Gemmatirosa kalamazoonensis]
MPGLDAVRSKQSPTKLYRGIDMYNPSNLSAPLRGKVTGKLEYVTEREGGTPAFVGRYIKNPASAAQVTDKEIEFIRGQGCSLLPIYCPTQAHTGMKGPDGQKWGREAAKNAVGLARGLHIPDDVFVYANIEPHWVLTPDWVVGWCEGYDALTRQGFGGLYCGQLHIAPGGPIVQAMKTLGGRAPAVWLTRAMGDGRDPGLLPAAAQEIGDVDIWQYAVGVVGQGLDSRAWGYDRDLASSYAFDHMWAPD